MKNARKTDLLAKKRMLRFISLLLVLGITSLQTSCSYVLYELTSDIEDMARNLITEVNTSSDSPVKAKINPYTESNFTSKNKDIPPKDTTFYYDSEIISDHKALEDVVSYMRDNYMKTLDITLSDIEVWETFTATHEDEYGVVDFKNIKNLKIIYEELDEYVNATINIEYEMFVNIINAYDNNDESTLTENEKIAYDMALDISSEILGLPSSNSLYGKALALNDYLSEHITYDDNYAGNDNAFNVYGALVDGVAVCQGYANAYSLILHIMGIESMVIVGTSRGENHAWNLVNYGDSTNPKWYHVDPTWNDNDSVFKTTGSFSHEYLNLSDDIIKADHEWNAYEYPPALFDDLNYFNVSGLVASSVSELCSIFSAQESGENEPIYFEARCKFPVTGDDLDAFYPLLEDMDKPPSFSYSITEYGEDFLLIITCE